MKGLEITCETRSIIQQRQPERPEHEEFFDHRCAGGFDRGGRLVRARRYSQDRDNVSDSAWTEAVVTKRDISSSIRATGIIKPMVGAEVRVGSRVSGVVTRLHTNVGDEVSPGQLLAELDSTELQARLDQAVAAFERSQAEFKYAGSELRRKKQLSQSGVVSPTDLELAENAFRVAELRVKEAEANVEYAEHSSATPRSAPQLPVLSPRSRPRRARR